MYNLAAKRSGRGGALTPWRVTVRIGPASMEGHVIAATAKTKRKPPKGWGPAWPKSVREGNLLFFPRAFVSRKTRINQPLLTKLAGKRVRAISVAQNGKKNDYHCPSDAEYYAPIRSYARGSVFSQTCYGNARA